MSIQDLGAIGELIAAIAVVVSLGYLAVQIRQNSRQVEDNTKAVKAAAVSAGLQLIASNRLAIYNDADTADIWHRGVQNPTKLDELERMRFRLIFSNAMDALFNTYTQTKASGFSPETWEAQLATLGRVLSSPGGQWFWGEFKEEYRADFRAEVEAMVRGADS